MMLDKIFCCLFKIIYITKMKQVEENSEMVFLD